MTRDLFVVCAVEMRFPERVNSLPFVQLRANSTFLDRISFVPEEWVNFPPMNPEGRTRNNNAEGLIAVIVSSTIFAFNLISQVPGSHNRSHL